MPDAVSSPNRDVAHGAAYYWMQRLVDHTNPCTANDECLHLGRNGGMCPVHLDEAARHPGPAEDPDGNSGTLTP